MNYDIKRTEQDLYNCALWHYEIEKLDWKKDVPNSNKTGNYWRLKTRYKDNLFIETSDKDLNKDKLALADILVKIRMKIDKVRENNKNEKYGK